MDNYRKHHALSNSDLNNFEKSIHHYIIGREQQTEPTPAMKFGTMLHEYILEPNVFMNKYKVLNLDERPEPTKAMNSKLNIAWKKELTEKYTLIEETELQEVQRLKRNFDRVANEINLDLSKCKLEQEIYFNVLDGKLQCKSKLDIIDLENNIIYDLKTGQDVYDEKKLTNSIINFKYYRQAEFYRQAAIKEYKKDFDFKFIFLDKNSDLVRLVKLHEKFEERANLELVLLLTDYVAYKNKPEIYSIYVDNEIILEAPAWF